MPEVKEIDNKGKANMKNLTKRKPLTKLEETKNIGKQVILIADTFTLKPKDKSEIWVRDFMKLKKCSRQGTYDAVKRGELNAVKKYNSLFIIWDDDAKKWFPKVLNVKA
jgi:hypothetical protein